MAERLSKFVLYTYGIPDLFFALMVNMEAYFFTAFLTDYAQFSLVLAGRSLGLTSLIDIVCALVGGVVLQKVTLKYGGKYRSWSLVGPPLIAPLFILQFTRIGSDLTAAVIVMIRLYREPPAVQCCGIGQRRDGGPVEPMARRENDTVRKQGAGDVGSRSGLFHHLDAHDFVFGATHR